MLSGRFNEPGGRGGAVHFRPVQRAGGGLSIFGRFNERRGGGGGGGGGAVRCVQKKGFWTKRDLCDIIYVTMYYSDLAGILFIINHYKYSTTNFSHVRQDCAVSQYRLTVAVSEIFSARLKTKRSSLTIGKKIHS